MARRSAKQPPVAAQPDDTEAQRLLAAGLEAYRQRQFGRAAELIEQGLQLDPSKSPGWNVTLAHAHVLGARWDAVARFLPPNTNWLAVGGWLSSLYAGRPIDAAGNPIPWYTYPAIEFLEDKIGRDFQVFEWGSGGSTLWWAKRVSRVVAVESDEPWYRAVAAAAPANAQVLHRPDADGYVAALAEAGMRFDVIVVDGVQRARCVSEVIAHAPADAIVIYDNTDNRDHADSVRELVAAGWHRIDFYGLIPQHVYKNCTSIFFKDAAFLDRAELPSEKVSCLGPSCAQAMQSGMGVSTGPS